MTMGRTNRKKINRTAQTLKREILVHYYDHHENSFQGLTFNEDGKSIKNIMCTGNIVCHKVATHRARKFTRAETAKHVKNYLCKISNPAMRDYIRFRQFMLEFRTESTDPLNYPYFYLDDGFSAEDYYDLMNPNIKNCRYVFNFDTLIYFAYHFSHMIKKDFVERLSALLHTKITYEDLGEMLFGGKDNLSKLKQVFKNLDHTVGLQNVYLLIKNEFWLDRDKLWYMICRIFDAKFVKDNLKVKTDQHGRYAIIKDVLTK